MFRRKRIVIWSLVIIVIAGGIYTALQPRPVLVDLATIERGPLELSVEDDGVTRIRERYVISAPLPSRLLRITLDVGDPVKANETVVARLEPTDPTLLDPRQIAQANARVRAAERRLDAAKAELARAEVELNFAESEMGRTRELFEQRAASELEFREKELQFKRMTETVRAASFAVDIANYELELQRAAMILTEPTEGDESTSELEIHAPIDGSVLRVFQESTTVVTAGAALLEIGDPDDLEIVVDVLSRDAVRVSPGDLVTLRHWGGESAIEGVVRLVEPSGFTKLSALGVEEQRVNVVVDFVNAPESRQMLGDHFRVDCEIVVWKSDDCLRVPTSALFRVDDRWHVFVVENQIARRVPVEIQHNNGEFAEVVSGPEEGTRVIIYPSDQIEEGTLIADRRAQ